ncbi:MAG: putative collagen-binding domain-containing protein, partial [Microcoleaceae cyanobacterium]
NGGKNNSLQNGLHRYQPHVQDWKSGDPTWQNGEGKGIIGAVNYLASEEMNSIYFLTNNLKGDGQEVFPWTNPNERLRFDVSKLDQWEVVFSHMDKQGIQLHVVTQEQENDQDLDGGGLGVERKLYYRELVARFGHHLGVNWNLGEENTNTTQQRKDFASYIRDLDPYDHQIVLHTFPTSQDTVYNPLLGFQDFEGASLQTNNTHELTKTWVERSAAAGHPWIVTIDEIGPPVDGVKPDNVDRAHDAVRQDHLWGNLMAGGAGAEWYFGYGNPNDDLDTEDWRSRDLMWDQTRHALDFFQDHLPFTEMKSMDEVTSASNDYAFAKAGQVYAVYLPDGGTTNINLPNGNYTVQWYNPRSGGNLQTGTVTNLTGGRSVSLGQAPSETSKDWVALVQNGSGRTSRMALQQSDSTEGVDPLLGNPSGTQASSSEDNTLLTSGLGSDMNVEGYQSKALTADLTAENAASLTDPLLTPELDQLSPSLEILGASSSGDQNLGF